MAGSADPPLPPRRSSRLRVSGAASWDTALVVQPEGENTADIETVLLENDFRCVRARDEHDPAALVVLEQPQLVVIDARDERFDGRQLGDFSAAVADRRVPVIVLGGTDRPHFGGRLLEIPVARGCAPAGLREAVKAARRLAGAGDHDWESALHRHEKKLPAETRRYASKKAKLRTARYSESATTDAAPSVLPGRADPRGRRARKRYNTTLSFKPTGVATAPSVKPLVAPRRRKVTTGESTKPTDRPQAPSAVPAPGAVRPRPGDRGRPSAEELRRRRLRKTASKAGQSAARRLSRATERPRQEFGEVKAGTLIAGRYEVRGVLGTGGMATVYRCRDMELEEEIALKLVDATRGTPSAVQRFRHEMRVCRRLNHRNIVRTYEFGEWRGQRFLTMELLDGRDLNQLLLITQGPLDTHRGLGLMEQACAGLSAAHAIGVIHRDIKPHNLFVVADGSTLKIMDFGIAKTEDISLTVPGSDRVLGTPAYLAPERLREQAELSARTDIYSLGVVMFQVFTGRLPFTGRDISSLLTSIVLDQPPRPSDFGADIPPALESTILRAMAREPADRHASCAEIRAELTALRDA